MPKPLALLVALALGCGASTRGSTPTTPDPIVVERVDDVDAEDRPPVVIEGRRFEGPFADWESICGAPDEQDGRFERCSAQIVSLSGGPFEKIASYHEGDPGSALFALKTSAGWFVPELPDGRPLYGGRSHHTPASASVDATSSSFSGGVLNLVIRGGSSSFLPGQGAFGSSSNRWTRVYQCQLSDAGVVCDAGEIVWQERCQASPQPAAGPQTPGPTRTCEETGTDIAMRD